MIKKVSLFCKAIAVSLLLLNSFYISFAQGSPPQQGNNGHISPNDGGPGEPLGSSSTLLNSNAIYILLVGVLLFIILSFQTLSYFSRLNF